MLKIKVVSVGDTCCKVELTSEDGKEVVSVLHPDLWAGRRNVCCVRGAGDRDGWWVEAPNIKLSENLRQRIQDALYYDALYRPHLAEHHGR